jgi:RNA polymerase sigma factor (sigma-70 family)
MTGDPSAAEDIVQEAFVRMYARLQDRHPPDRLETYLRRTVVNLSHDRHRKLRTAREFLALTAHVSQRQPDMDSRLVFRELLQKLPHRQRAALVLRYYEDLSEHDAAEIIHCSVPALKQLVQRALKTLRSNERGGRHA